MPSILWLNTKAPKRFSLLQLIKAYTLENSSPSTPFDLFEANNENTQLQENVENNDTDIDERDETTTKLQVNNNNSSSIFG